MGQILTSHPKQTTFFHSYTEITAYLLLLVTLMCALGMPICAINRSSSVIRRFRGGSSDFDVGVVDADEDSRSRSRSRCSRIGSRFPLPIVRGSGVAGTRRASSIRFVASSIARVAASMARASRSAILRMCDGVAPNGGSSSTPEKKKINRL